MCSSIRPSTYPHNYLSTLCTSVLQSIHPRILPIIQSHICPSTHSPSHLSIRSPMYPLIRISTIHASVFCPLVHPSPSQPGHPFSHLSTHSFICILIHQPPSHSPIYLFSYPFIYPSIIHPSLCPSICLYFYPLLIPPDTFNPFLSPLGSLFNLWMGNAWNLQTAILPTLKSPGSEGS